MPRKVCTSPDGSGDLPFSPPEPSTLSLKEDSVTTHAPSEIPRGEESGRPEDRSLGIQMPSTVTPITRPRQRTGHLDSQHSSPRQKIGHLDAQRKKRRPRFDSSVENTYQSRIALKHCGVRIAKQLIKKVNAERENIGPKKPLMKDVFADGLVLWLKERAKERAAGLGIQMPTGSSSSGSIDQALADEEILRTTTTTTTLGIWMPKSVLLPGVAAIITELSNLPHEHYESLGKAIEELRNLPHKSRHEIEVNFAYAWNAYRKGEGIHTPNAFARANYINGKQDAMIDVWLGQMQAEEARRQKLIEEQQRRDDEQREEWDRYYQLHPDERPK